jgi:hypothetical protein
MTTKPNETISPASAVSRPRPKRTIRIFIADAPFIQISRTNFFTKKSAFGCDFNPSAVINPLIGIVSVDAVDYHDFYTLF